MQGLEREAGGLGHAVGFSLGQPVGREAFGQRLDGPFGIGGGANVGGTRVSAEPGAGTV